MLAQAHAHLGLQLHAAALVGAMHFLPVGETACLAARTDALARHVVQAEHHVLEGTMIGSPLRATGCCWMTS